METGDAKVNPSEREATAALGRRDWETCMVCMASDAIGHSIAATGPSERGCCTSFRDVVASYGLDPRRMTVEVYDERAEERSAGRDRIGRGEEEEEEEAATADGGTPKPDALYCFSNIFNPRRIWVKGSRRGRAVKLRRYPTVPDFAGPASPEEDRAMLEYYARDRTGAKSEKRLLGRCFYCLGSCAVRNAGRRVVFLYERV